MTSPKFYIKKTEPWMDVVEIHFGVHTDTGRLIVATPSMMKLIDNSDLVNIPKLEPPMLSIDPAYAGAALQSLMDALWGFGVRPSDIGTPGHLAATTKHLEDMRAIAFGKLEIARPET